MTHNTWLSWSSGKDSAWSVYVLNQSPEVNVTGIFTTINETQNRVAMHGTRLSILNAQAKSLDLPLHTIHIPDPCDNATYESRMRQLIQKAKAQQVTQMAFGDLFLDDLLAFDLGRRRDVLLDDDLILFLLRHHRLGEVGQVDEQDDRVNRESGSGGDPQGALFPGVEHRGVEQVFRLDLFVQLQCSSFNTHLRRLSRPCL